jgi:hypothetical protein
MHLYWSFADYFSCHYPLNRSTSQPLTKHLHCIGCYKSSRDDLKDMGGCAQVCKHEAILHKRQEHLWILVSKGGPGTKALYSIPFFSMICLSAVIITICLT